MCREEKNKTLIVFKLYPELLLYISIETCVAAGLPGLRTYMCILSGICHLIVTKSQLYIYTIDLQPPSVYSPSGSLAGTF